MSFLLGFRGRAGSAAFASFGLAVLAPSGLTGADVFLKTPLGPAIACVACIAIGASVEETGTISRIRMGLAIRLFGALLLAGAAVWTALLRPDNDVPGGGFGWILFAIGAAGVAYAVRADAATYADPRSGQRIRLQELTGSAMSLAIEGGPAVTIPTSEILVAVVATGSAGRGVFIKVRGRGRLGSEAATLPWVTSGLDGDTFLLTEHQAGMDAEALVDKLREAAGAGQERGYR